MTHGLQGRKSSMLFNQSDDEYLALANQGSGVANLNPLASDPFSISLWFYTDSTSTHTLFSNRQSTGDGWWLGLTNQKLDFRWYSSGSGSNDITTFDSDGYRASFYNGPWSHAVITYNGNGNGTGLKMYINAALIETGPSATIGTTTSSDEIRIGKGYSASSYKYSGSISNISFWDKELTEPEIDFIYHGNDGGRGPGDLNFHPSFSNCIGWWIADHPDDDASKIYDNTASNNNFTPTNSPVLLKLSP